MARHALNGTGHVDNLGNSCVAFIHVLQLRIHVKGFIDGHFQVKRNGFRDSVCLGIAEIQRPAHISDRRLCFHCTKGENLRDISLPIFSLYIFYDFAPPFDAEVDIDIRHADTLRIQETLENQAVTNGVKVGNSKGIRHQTSGGGASARSHHNAVCLSKIDKIPNDEEILYIAHIFNDGKLIIKTVCNLRRHIVVTFRKSFLTKLPQILLVGLALRRNKLRQMIVPKDEFHIAFHGDFMGIFNGFRGVSEDFPHLILAL